MTIKFINLWSSFLVVATSFKKMIDVNTFKQILIKNGTTDLSDEQIIKLRDQQEEMAEIFFGMWLKSTKVKNKTV